MTKLYLADWKEDEVILKAVELYDGGYTIQRITTLMRQEDGVDVDYVTLRNILIELGMADDEIRYPGCNPDVPTIESSCVYLRTPSL